MNPYLNIRKIELPHTKHIMEVCTSDDQFDIQAVTNVFSKACTIVDAQFYYTNPLLFVFVKPEDCKEFAQLYESYFLIPPRYYDTIDVNTTCIAVNAIFISHVCSLSELSEEEPKLKHSYKELQEEVDTRPNVLNSFFELYQEKGLYIIGIDNNEKA